MKYSNSNKPLVCLQSQSSCYKGTRTFNPKGVLWHCTGANNPTLKRYVQPSDGAPDRDYWLKLLGTNANRNDWNHKSVDAGLNCWIGKLADGTVTTVQTMPWNYRPWGCGSGSKGTLNDTHIQFEMCEDALTDRSYFDKCYREGCEITAYLCKMYGIDPNGTFTFNGVKVPTILCHYDSYHLGMGSNHGDVYNWFKKFGKTMDDVRRDVTALIKGSDSNPAPAPTPTPTTDPVTKAEPEKFIEKIAPYVKELAPKYGIKCNSAVIAQACLESAYGTSNKAKYHNYFGLKYRANRLTCHSGTFSDSSKEQAESGAYYDITTQWFSFANMRDGVEGYFQFINIDNYKAVKGITDPKKYLEAIRAAGYATSQTYVQNVMNVVTKYNLTKYDGGAVTPEPKPDPTPTPTPVKITPQISYAVKTAKAKLPEAKNGGVIGNGEKIVGIRIGVTHGTVEYRAHCGGRWLPKVTGNDWNDYNNGYAGDDKNAIDAIQVYYHSDANATGYYEAVYAVKPVGYANFLPEVPDTDWQSSDGNSTAGIFSKPIAEIKIYLRKC